MSGTTTKAAWRLLAAVPFVLLLGIVGIKLTAGDPNSPFNSIPGAQTIQELGEDAPTSNVHVKLPKSKSPKPTSSSSASASASTSPTDAASSSAATKNADPTRTTSSPKPTSSSPKPTPTKTTQQPSPTPTPTQTLSPREQCEAQGKHWRFNIISQKYYCSSI